MFSQSGNDSKWFLKQIIFQNRYVALETILNFHFDYLHTSLISTILGPPGTTPKKHSSKTWCELSQDHPTAKERVPEKQFDSSAGFV